MRFIRELGLQRWFAGVFGLTVFSPALADLRPFTPEDLLQVRTIVDAQISPDGRQVLYVVSHADPDDDTYRTNIWMTDVHGRASRRLTNGHKSDEMPRWSPDGRKVAFISECGATRQIWMIDPTGGEAEQLTDVATGINSFEWSRDGRQIAFLSAPVPSEKQAEGTQEAGDSLVVDRLFERVHLHVVDVQTRAHRQITRGDFTVPSFSWSPDARQIAFTRRPTARVIDEYETDLYVVALESAQIRPLMVRKGRDDTPRWSPDGKHVAFVSSDGGMADFESLYVFVVPAAGGTPKKLSSSVEERIYNFFGWSADDTELYFHVRQGVTMQALAAPFAAGKVRAISSGERVYDCFSFAAAANTMVFAASDPAQPRDLYVSAIDRFRPRKILVSNPQLAEFRFGSTSVIRWRSRDGLEIEGLLTLPVGYEPGRKYPTIVVLHGGPSAAFTVGFAPQISTDPVPLPLEPYPPQLYAEHGYALLMPNVRGSGGYGGKFRKANVRDLGGGDFEDVMAGIDELVKRGLADENRLGVMGWSYGGYLSAWAISQTSRFKVAQVGAGVSNMISMYGTTNQPHMVEAYFGGPPWEQKALYENRSAIYFAPQIRTPTLIQHGEDDPDVPFSQAEELYRALHRRNVHVELVRYPKSGHVPTEPALNLDVLRRNLAWFNRWLKPGSH